MSFVEPLAAGSGIPEVKTYLNGVHIKGLLTIRCCVCGCGCGYACVVVCVCVCVHASQGPRGLLL